MDNNGFKSFSEECQDFSSLEILDAEHVYLLMNSKYRVSRNVRAKWFFSRINSTVTIGSSIDRDEHDEELEILSVIPRDPPPHWGPEGSHTFKYKILPSTIVSLLARRYRLVFCLDLSPSIMVVDAFSGEVMLDSLIISLQKCFKNLTASFVIPGSNLKLTPQLYVTIIAHTSAFSLPNQQVIVQGWLLTVDNVQRLIDIVQRHLYDVEKHLAESVASASNGNGLTRTLASRQVSYERTMEYSYEDELDTVNEGIHKRLPLTSPDTSFVNLIRYGILALQLLPDNTSAAIIVVTDGIINIPDIHLFQSLLAQLRNSAISCSFLHIGSNHQPDCCWGYPTFPDLMQFIATATYGACISLVQDDVRVSSNSVMNPYHQGILVWNFQWGPYLKSDVQKWPPLSVGGDTLHSSELHMEKKLHLQKQISVPLNTLMSCRLREGYGIREIFFKGNDHVDVTLVLPWKPDITIVYLASSSWPPDTSSCQYKVIIEGSYEFLHDLTCTAKKPIKSRHRADVVKKFCDALLNLSQTDALLVHLHSFASNAAYYMIPDSIRSGVPLFYLPVGSSRPALCSNDFAAPKFAEFWEPICMLDINIWQKWMHTHRIGIILMHDLPLPKYLHLPNSNDRYHTVQCRQALAALNALLVEWSSFVLIENHSYITFLFEDHDKPPLTFYVIRITSKPPCMVIRLAFLGGVSSHQRNEIVDQLKEKIFSLKTPSRPSMKDIYSRKSDREKNSFNQDEFMTSKHSQTFCCIELLKPVEKILIRYERTPNYYTSPLECLFLNRSYSHLNTGQRKAISMLSSLGRYLHHRRWVWSAQSCPFASIPIQAVARILSTLVKIRLLAGFHFAHSHSGIVNMVLEVYMMDDSAAGNDKDFERFPCMIQYVIFPPHSTTNLSESISEEEVDVDCKAKEDNGEILLVIECWVEPQHGRIYQSEARYLEGLTYKELPETLLNVDLECISTMLTFEHISLMCQRKNVSSPEPRGKDLLGNNNLCNSIQQMPFPFDLMRLLPKCQQAELLFSTLIQDFETDFIDSKHDITPNKLLIGLLQNGVAGIHDREIHLADYEHLQFLQLLKKRKKTPFVMNQMSVVGDIHSSIPHCVEGLPIKTDRSESHPEVPADSNNFLTARWRCYVKGVSTTHLIITFIPMSFDDLILLNTQERLWDERDEVIPEHSTDKKLDGLESSCGLGSYSNIEGRRYTLPIYVYDCSMAGLIADLIQNDEEFDHCDIHLDHRPTLEVGEEETATIKSSNQSSSSSKLASPEPRTYDTDGSSSGRSNWKSHLTDIYNVHVNCFVSAIYQSLQNGLTVYSYDVQYSMDELCSEIALEIDITSFLLTVCYHAKNWSSLKSQHRHDANVAPVMEDVEQEPLLSFLNKTHGFPSTFWSSFSCATLEKVHHLIREKFSDITKKDFVRIESNPDYYYYCPYALRARSLSGGTKKCTIRSGLDDSKDVMDLRIENIGIRDEINEHQSPEPKSEEDSTCLEGDISRLDSLVSGSPQNEECSNSSSDVEEDYPPFFIHLVCTVKYNNTVFNSSVQTLPTCFRTVLTNAGFLEDSLDNIDPNQLVVTLDIICLSLPPAILAMNFGKNTTGRSGMRTTSFCSSSPIPFDCLDDDLEDAAPYFEESVSEMIKDPLGHLPKFQNQAIKNYKEEIVWMLQDEKASFARDVHPITEEVLDTVANHIRNSSRKPGCIASKIPLVFVFGPEQSLDKFVQEFQRMSLREYQLIQEGKYYYLALKRTNSLEHSSSFSSNRFVSKHLIVQSNPHWNDATELRELLESTEDTRNNSTLHNHLHDILDSGNGLNPNEEENNVGRAINDKVKGNYKGPRYAKDRRRHSDRMRGKKELVLDQTVIEIDAFSLEGGSLQSTEDVTLRDRSSSTEDETKERKNYIPGSETEHFSAPKQHPIRRRKRSLGPLSTPNITKNSTEDGYDGDSSDVDNEGDSLVDLEFQKPSLPNFWLILCISDQAVDVYFQFRAPELDEEQLQHRKEVNCQIMANIRNVCKLVNQALLLQDLHDNRMCNQLLEPEANEDIWKHEEAGFAGTGIQGAGVRWRSTDGLPDSDQYVDCQDYLEANMKFMPGAFSCPVVWEAQFQLHPRLKTGHGRPFPKVSMHALKGVLSPMSVNNRKNMFVYKERTSGAVFYLRLYESPPANLHHQVDCTQSVARHSVTDDGTSLIGSRSSSMQSLTVPKISDTTEDVLEPRSRVNSLPEKDRDQNNDTMSVSSCVSSSRQKYLDDVITLSVHGISEAGSEIKEDLMKALQNRLDDATLDVISLAFVRNSKCKLTLEDVQFIQRPGEVPKSVIHFTVQVRILPFLEVVIYYLCQELMSFLNIPFYVDPRPENQFQCFKKETGEPVSQVQEMSTAFLYITPQGAGNKGIACIMLTVVDGQGNPVRNLECPRPVPDAYKDGLLPEDFENLTSTCLYENISSTSKSPGPMALVQFQIWEKGIVDIKQLGEKLGSALRHALWDLVMEYRLLTAPIAEMPHVEESHVVCSEPSTPLKMKRQMHVALEGMRPKERAASPLLMVQPTSPSLAPGSAHHLSHILAKEEEVHIAMDAEVLRRQEKYEIGEKGVLHTLYSSTAESWLEFGKNIGVSSIQRNNWTLTSRRSVELLLRDWQGIINTQVSDTTPRIFKKEVDFVPFYNCVSGREKKRSSGSPAIEGLRSSVAFPGKVNCFILIARNVRQWRVSSGQLDKDEITELAENKEASLKINSEYQKFQPYICVYDGQNSQEITPQTIAAAALKSCSGAVGVAAIQSPGRENQILFVPRQRLLLIFVRDCQVTLYTYNWSSDKLNKFTDKSNKLVDWYNRRSCFLSSIIFQKLGLFLNQPAQRKCDTCKSHNQDQRTGSSQTNKCSSVDLDILVISGNAMLRREAAGNLSNLNVSQQRRTTPSPLLSLCVFSDLLRDNKPQHVMRVPPLNYFLDPVVQHLSQVCEIRNSDTRDRQKKLLMLWQDREARVNMPILLLKQISRIEHYCLTPLLFHPLWRNQVAAGRDHMVPNLPPALEKFMAQPYLQNPQQPSVTELIALGMRSRHSSGTSVKGPDLRHIRKASIGASSSSHPSLPSHSLSRNMFPDEWNTTMCNAYIGEFVQYLQTLGFVVSTHSRQTQPLQKIMKDRGKLDAQTIDEQQQQHQPISSNFPQYLYKFLLGGILLLELVIYEPYFGLKIYTFESMRLRALSHRTMNSQFVVAFLDECDKMKVSMHLHSFTYDYHLRNIHSYISGRQMSLRQGYHLVGFLDDFLKYYQKSPNFARNLVHQGHITVSPTSTTAQQLFDYLLKYDRSYDMRAMDMNSLEDGENPEYVLVQMSTRKVSYRDGSDTRQTDEFDVSLLVARDTLQFGTSHLDIGERYSLTIKYFIILTSCREMFPKPVVEEPQGTFRAVITTSLIPSRPSSTPSSRRMSVERSETELSLSSDRHGGRKVSVEGGSGMPSFDKSTDSRGEFSSLELTDTVSSTLTNSSTHDSDTTKLENSIRLGGIRQENVNYMGYFSTHEELMNNIMMEQVDIVKLHIKRVVDRAMVDCRRDYLWERLQKGNRDSEDSGRRRKEDPREMLQGLSYTEFTDLLKLVLRKTLTDLDSQLAGITTMPINWYQTLVKVLLSKYQESNRHFTAPDGNTQHVVILDANNTNTFMLLSIDLHSSRTELCVVFRKQPITYSSVYSLVEDVVNVCAFHIWSAIL